jgi:flagellar protein FlbD
MIEVTKLNNVKYYINPFLVETIEETPDTVVVFNSGHKLVVTEKVKDIQEKFQDFIAGAIFKGINLKKD